MAGPWEDYAPAAPSKADPAAARAAFAEAASSAALGVPKSAVLAHTALETSPDGSKTVGAHNYGNIKAGRDWSGPTTSVNAKEFDKSGQAFSEASRFRAYESPEKAAEDYAAFIRAKFPAAAKARTPEEFAQALKAGGYATDPAYVRKLTSVAETQGGKPWEDYTPAKAEVSKAGAPVKSTGVGETAKNLALGAVRGFADIGDTIINAGANVLGRVSPDVQSWNDERRGSLADLDASKADSTAYTVGRVGGNIAATAPVGGLGGAGLKGAGGLMASLAPRAGAALQAVGQAASTGGLSSGGVTGAAGLAARAAGGAVAGAAGSGLVNPEDAGAGAVVGAAAPLVLGQLGKVASAVGSAVRPPGDRADLARKAIEQYRIPLGVADISASNMTKGVRSVLNDTPLVGRIGDTQRTAVQEGFNRAVGSTFGAPEAKLTPEVLSRAKDRLGAEFDRVWNGNTVAVDHALMDDLQRLHTQAAKLPENEGGSLAREIQDLYSKMQPDASGALAIPGDVANKFQSYLRRRAEGSAGLRNELSDLRRTIIQAFNRGVDPADADALRTTQAQYKALKTVEPILNSAEVGVAGRAAGDVPAALLSSAVLRSYGNGSGTALGDLAQIGSHFVADRVSRTGGSTRALIQNSAVGGALGVGAFSNPAAAALAVPVAAGLNSALGSPALGRLAVGQGRGLSTPLVQGAERAAPVAVTGAMENDPYQAPIREPAQQMQASPRAGMGQPGIADPSVDQSARVSAILARVGIHPLQGGAEGASQLDPRAADALDAVALDHGISTKAAAAIRERAAGLPPEQQADFLRRSLAAMERRGLAKKPGADRTFDAVMGAGGQDAALRPLQARPGAASAPASRYWGE